MLGMRILKAPLLALALSGAAFSAQATNIQMNFGNIGTGFNPFGVHGASETFTDQYTFTLGTASDVNISVSPLTLQYGGKKYLSFSTLFAGFQNQTFSDNAFFSNVAAGTYSYFITGTTNGLFGGNYGTVINASPVPVPAAFLLFGSGLAGLIAARRARKKVSSSVAIA